MNILGSKGRKADKITGFLNKVLDLYPEADYWEPFMGACYVLAKINPDRRRFAADLNKDLVDLFLALKDGWRPPASVPFQLYKESKEAHRRGERSPDLTFIGFAASFGGSWYTNYARDERGNDDSGIPKNAAKSLVRRFETGRLAEVPLYHQDYHESGKMMKSGDIVYLDPPYQGTAKQLGDEDATMDYREFWRWARSLVQDQHCLVYVSTFHIFPGWKPVLDISAMVNFSSNHEGRFQHEYLVRLKRPGEA